MQKITLFLLLLFSLAPCSPLFAQPSVAFFSPTSGLVGTTVSIVGTGFSATPLENTVTLNGTAAQVIAATPTQLTITVPIGSTTGAIEIQTGGNTATSSSVFTVLSSTNCNGISNNNSKYWYFGNQAALAFESNGPIALADSAMSQVEGVATMSDANGNLLFYTNGITIYNRNHQVMENGSGLLSHSSNTQAAFIVPFPGNPDKYFVITPGPYYYSIVDMTLDNGNGAVVPTSKNILLNSENSEKVAGLLAANQTDIWLIAYGTSEKRFNTYLITPSGMAASPVVSEFEIASGHFGYMKISPDQTKIATANFANSFHLYDFDAVTGAISNQRIVPFAFGGFGSYGIEFSPDSRLVYVADHRGQNRVHQFDITLATPELISASGFALDVSAQALGALQLGPDNRIYLARENSTHMGVINQPNVVGAGCQFILDAVNLSPKSSNLGLPGFVASALVRTEPYITAFDPVQGEAGTTVTITGVNFNTTPGNNTVTFNGVTAVVGSATENTLTATVPENATTGQISVAVGCGLVTSTADFTVNILAVSDFSTTRFALFPNPSDGIFNIRTASPIENAVISILDLNGRLIYQSKHEELSDQLLDLTGVQRGMYVLKISGQHAHYSQKLIKH